jgi:hypothetical protein
MRGFPFLRASPGHHDRRGEGLGTALALLANAQERLGYAAAFVQSLGDVRPRLRRRLQGRVVRGFLIDPKKPVTGVVELTRSG